MATKVVVRHFHEGNDADRKIRGNSSYATVARIIDLDTGKIVEAWTEHPNFPHGFLKSCEVWAYCSKKDVPSRSNGRFIAVGRLQKQFPVQCKDATFGPHLEYLKVKE